MHDPILQILIQNGYLDEEQAKYWQDLSNTESKPIRRLVIDQEVLSEDDKVFDRIEMFKKCMPAVREEALLKMRLLDAK